MSCKHSQIVGRGAKVRRQSDYLFQTASWPQDELALTDLGDKRLDQRLFYILESFASQPNASIPQSAGTWGEAKGVYRFLDNPKVTPIKILESHFEKTKDRIQDEEIVLAVQDTTSLNYTSHPETSGLGNIGTDPRSRGMLVHSTLAFTPSRTPLGLIDQQVWTRPPEEYGKKHQRSEKSIDQKESWKWISSLRATELIQQESPNTLLINIGDREADIYELFLEAKSTQTQLLVRAAWDRRVDHSEKYLWARLEAQDLATTLSVAIPHRKGKAKRVASLEVRFAPVVLKSPRNNKSKVPFLNVWGIYVNEPSPPKNEEALCWLLLTTLPVESAEDAVRYVDYYSVRFSIELFHKVLKSGCNIEKHQLKTAERLINCLAIDSIVAWRVMFLTMMGRSVPNLPCTVLFEDHEWKALYCFARQTQQPPAQAPSLGEAVRLVAQMGGFLGRKSDGQPGIQVLWRGMQILSVLSGAWIAFGPESNSRSG